MKHLIATTVIVLLLLSCKKEMNSPANGSSNSNNSFFQRVKTQLKDSLAASDYSSIDTNQLFKSKDAQSDIYFVRGAFQKKEIAIDFILLKTDSLGNIRQGKIIHVNKAKSNRSRNNFLFQGQFVITSLDRSNTVKKEVVNGRWIKQTHANSTMKVENPSEDPAGEQELPEVVVTSYTYDGSYTGDWYWLGGFYDDGGGGGGYTYGNSSGGGGGENSNSNNDNDSTIVLEIEPTDDPTIKVEDYEKCFSTVPDENATYQIKLFADLPVNGDPSKIFDWSSLSPGHSFVQLYKSNGTQSIQQNFGFYPEYGWKAPSNVSVDSKIVDNAGHEFNASLTLTINSSQFQAALNQIQAIAGYDYNITSWNCTDFALSIFNAASSLPLTIPPFPIPTSAYPLPTTLTYSNTPQGLYNEIQSLQISNNSNYGTADIPGVCGYVGASHGSCK